MCCNEKGYDGAITQKRVLFVGLHTVHMHHIDAHQSIIYADAIADILVHANTQT